MKGVLSHREDPENRSNNRSDFRDFLVSGTDFRIVPAGNKNKQLIYGRVRLCLINGNDAAILKGGWYDKIQGDVYTLLESRADTNRLRKAIIYFIAALILLNVLVVILETVNSVYLEYTAFFHLFDLVTVIVFSIEYVLRIWCCVKNPLYSLPVQGRIRYALSPLHSLILSRSLHFIFL